MSHDVGKVLVVGMDGLRYDLLTRSPAAAPVLHGLMAAGAHGTSLLPHGEVDGQTPAHTKSRPADPLPGERGRP
ncbi:hypothetical protein [Streptomyces sp. NPDC005303]|uniref:hypothetical protein n=1 Tax=Streptomyces sp. NPDC005303 TaxID=3155713 RepID=UPI0033BAC5A9